jgi:shikimate kinase
VFFQSTHLIGQKPVKTDILSLIALRDIMARNIILVGPMGAGKTTIGKQLAQQLGREFYDSDRVIEEHTGADIPLIFELEGEAGFRKREKNILADLVKKNDIVLATGGGVVLDPDNRELLSKSGFVVYLDAPLSQLINRTSKDKNRPLLQTEDPKKKLEEILSVRDPLYRDVADEIIKTDVSPVRNVVKKIMALVKKHNL